MIHIHRHRHTFKFNDDQDDWLSYHHTAANGAMLSLGVAVNKRFLSDLCYNPDLCYQLPSETKRDNWSLHEWIVDKNRTMDVLC